MTSCHHRSHDKLTTCWHAVCTSLLSVLVSVLQTWQDITCERTSHLYTKHNKEKQICHTGFNWVIRKSEMRHLMSLLGGEWPITQWFSRAWLLLMVYKDSMQQWPVNYIHYPGLDGGAHTWRKAHAEEHTIMSHDRTHKGLNSGHVFVLGGVLFSVISYLTEL